MNDREKKSPFKLFQEMLATLLTVPKQELDETLEQEQIEKTTIEQDEASE